MDSNSVEFRILHENPEYLETTVELLNTQWNISTNVRREALLRSSDTLPTHFILLNKSDAEVIGHSSLVPVQGRGDATIVESVLVSPSMRGKGLGRILMEKTEEYARKATYHTIYLSTLDKVGFYSAVGYTISEPVQTGGVKALGILNTEEVCAMAYRHALTPGGLPRYQKFHLYLEDRRIGMFG